MPQSNVEVVKLNNAEAVAEEAARRIVIASEAAIKRDGWFSIAMSGGNTPRLLYQLLASDPWRDQVQWEHIHVFWGDERRVPQNDPDSNYRMARETLLDHVPVPANQIYPMDGTGLARSAMLDYERILQRLFRYERRGWPLFDLVLLGLGADGHTASIFPGTRAVSDLSNKVLAYFVPQLGVERMTLTLPVINHAREILFLVAGESKSKMVHTILEGDYQPSTYPAQAVKPVDGNVIWLLDKAAASNL